SGTKEELTGGTPAENAAVTRGVLNGEIRGTKRNAVLLNAGAGLYVAGRAKSLQAGVTLAGELIDDGKAAAALNAYIAATHAV
ncbi:MAG: anthranilate phosphoribosyltransferase, partial [Oribacterium sp.]